MRVAAPDSEVAGERMEQQYQTATADAAAPAESAPPSPSQGQPATAQGGVTAPSPILYLAYSYQIGLELPADRLAGVMDAHMQACVAAGPRVCQLISSGRSGDPESSMRGSLAVRGEPAWLRSFMGQLHGDAERAGGRVRSQATTTEDLTRAIVDTEAQLRAMTTLRDRLQNLLASRPGKLSDLLEVERELARVQAQIDSNQSNLAVMRTRVAMSELTIGYESAPRAVASDTFEPLTDAFAGFTGILVRGVAMIVTLIAALIPWVLLIGLIVWLVLAWRKRRGGRLFRRPPPPAPPAAT
jgi:hypothetical protein